MKRRTREALSKCLNYLRGNKFAELVIELSLFIPLFFLPSLREIPIFRYCWPLDFFSQITNWTYDTVYIIWVVIIGGIASIWLLYRHLVLRYIYLSLSALRLAVFLVPDFWNQLDQNFRYILNSVLMFPLALVIPLIFIAFAFSVFVVVPNSSDSKNSGDRELQAWRDEKERHRQITGDSDGYSGP